MTCEEYKSMIGHTISQVTGAPGDSDMTFVSRDGTHFRFSHAYIGSESVSICEVIGDIDDLVGSPIIEAEEISSEGHPAPEYGDCYTWTFYRFSTANGSVTVRWLGTSNGYYGEEVDFEVIRPSHAVA